MYDCVCMCLSVRPLVCFLDHCLAVKVVSLDVGRSFSSVGFNPRFSFPLREVTSETECSCCF